MDRRVPAGLAVAFCLVVHASARAPMAPQDAPQLPTTFRSGIVAVPVDVRVLDRDGQPVTDLKPEDFSLYEDGVRQALAHFSRQILVAQAPGPGLRARGEVPPFVPAPQTHRIFLFVLGAGALGSRPLGPGTAILPDPSNALDGLLHMVRDRLLPQDQLALLAYNRATDFSTDHASVARLLQTLRASEKDFVAALSRQGLQAGVRSPADSAFAAAADPIAPLEGELGFAEYVSARDRPTGDVENLHYGIKYLRFMEGEKHLVYLTARGVIQPPAGVMDPDRAKTWEDFQKLAAAATDARVALHVVQTGGIPDDPGPFVPPVPVMIPKILVPGRAYFGIGGAFGSTGPTGSSGAPAQPGWETSAPAPPVPVPGMDAAGLAALHDLRTLASETGGHASIMADAAKAMERIDSQTRVDYLLSYYPSNQAWDGKYRAVKVEVNRPGMTVLFRHGYHVEQTAALLSRRAVVADGRLAAAVSSTRAAKDIGLTATAAFTKSSKGKGGELLVQIVIDAARVRWTTDELSRRVAHLDLAVLCGEARGKVVGQTRRVLDVTVTEARYGQVAKQGLPYAVKIPVTALPAFFKVAVYDYDANLAGSAVFRVGK